MTAEILRRAAAVLREQAETAGKRKDPWISEPTPNSIHPERVAHEGDPQWSLVADVMWPDAGRYIAMMHPPVGLALADWLDEHAAHVESRTAFHAGILGAGIDEFAVTLASAIVREPVLELVPRGVCEVCGESTDTPPECKDCARAEANRWGDR